MRILLTLPLVLALVSAADGRTLLKKPKRGFQVKVSEFTIMPGQDLEVCEYRRLPNKKPMDVDGFELRMPAGAHHFVIWAYSGNEQDDSKFPQGPVESVGCAGIGPGELAPQVLIPIQSPNARFRFPEGVALRLEPHQQVWLNPHMKNFDAAPIQPEVRFNFHRAKKRTVKRHAEGMIIGNMANIRVPAGGGQTITAEWTSPADLTLIQLATHQHQLGTYANIELPDATGQAWNRIYENTDWEHPRDYWPDPPIRLAKGDKIRITCTWDNTEGVREVRFGPETTDEMCFILGYYLRDDGDTAPITGGGCLPARRGLLCPLAPAVAQ
jgi:hypothetical protein